mmetsp:Transcript_8742/g.26180  ORF Transcript_8742/g.26180 Transcript_8742/m.26180 type:complete len:177 (-) Transcript_8742:677-1207(-)|eukprot:CAMPEP_0113562678 /NCGR_PEP_ID=MMETSP0015_2-20120614/20655_1 /TAXON_ID=2838 /ORGANISM="Odontella" /LENGTH=176 /DNA_ID=CAMNT_0000464591 /DNA_START=69 /DNA_END=599 /DNA_ORIENTATION=+ /assembly_acc=CAM_ASM_000160
MTILRHTPSTLLLIVALFATASLISVSDAFVPSPRSTKTSRTSSLTALKAVKSKKAAKTKKAKKSKVKKTAKTAKAAAEAAPTFKKGEFVASVAEKTGLSKADSERALAAVLDTITEEVADGKRISLLGFGSFKLSYRSARKGRNPQTGEELDIKASYSPSFTAAKAFKEKVNEGR